MGGLGWVLVLASWVRFGWVHKLMGLVGLGEKNGFTSISGLNSTKKTRPTARTSVPEGR